MKKVLFSSIVILFTTHLFSQLQGSFTTTINTICNGNVCEYEGPSILINEIQVAPSTNDGSISGPGGTDSGRGEWIELYNPNVCEPVDISCYYLGNAAIDGLFTYGGGFQLPAGTIIPPAGFCLVRGEYAPAVPSHLKVENGGNVVEIVIPSGITGDGVCVSSGGSRLWFPNLGGWFAFYDNHGVPQDAISWGDNNGVSSTPCIPVISSCNTGVTSLVSYNNIPADRKNYIYTGGVPAGNTTIRRMPDGGAWVTNQKAASTMGDCNGVCAQVGVSSCNGVATINVTGGSGNYSYEWNDSQGQLTQTATALCEGTYEVIVTDLDNSTSTTFTVQINELEITYTSSSTPAYCVNEIGTITVEGADGVNPYSYSVDNGATFQGGGQFDNLGEGTYHIVVQDANGCEATGTEIVIDNGEIEIDTINGIDPMCFGACDGVTSVTTSLGTAPYTFVWTDATGNTVGGNASVAEDLCDGTYTVEITDANGCQTSGSVTITEPEEIDPYFELTDFCGGEQNSASSIAETGGTFSIVSPLGDGATIDPITGEIYDGVEGTTYTIDYSFPNGCATHTETVTVNVIPVVSFVADTIAGPPPLVVEFTNTSIGADDYVWDFGNGTSTEDGNVVNVYNDVGVYDVTLVGTSAEGCSNNTAGQIIVYYPDMDYEFPNIFTPNGDNNNDLFSLVFEEWVASIEIVILNRWGNVVFESNDINFTWNGKVHNTGTDCTEGVYFYKATLTDYSGESVQEHGYVHLHR